MEKYFCNNLIRLRKALNKTQVEFGQPLGIKGTTISDYERGKIEPSERVLKLLEVNYSVDPKDLFDKDYNYRVESPKADWDRHGGWTPQTEKTDWGCLNKVVKIIDSDTIYSKALLQNIDAFYQAVMVGINRRKGERRKKDINIDFKDRRKGEDRRKIASGE